MLVQKWVYSQKVHFWEYTKSPDFKGFQADIPHFKDDRRKKGYNDLPRSGRTWPEMDGTSHSDPRWPKVVFRCTHTISCVNS